MPAALKGQNSSPTLEYNFITQNASFGFVVSAQGDAVWGGGRGGGIGNCHGLIQHNKIHDNFTHESGGGLRNCDGTIQYNEITSNTTLTDYALFNRGGGGYGCGGTIFANTIKSNLSLAGGGLNQCGDSISNLITENIAKVQGGGIHRSSGKIQSNIISYNRTLQSGAGGLDTCINTIENNYIFKNSGEFHGGLFVCTGLIQNNLIYGNFARSNSDSSQGAGLTLCEGQIINNIIWGNIAVKNAQIAVSSIPSYSVIQDWTEGGVGNITSDPLFVNPKKDDYHLQPGSPCIDAGSTTTLTSDFDGDVRPIDGDRLGAGGKGDGSDFDIGADEFIIPGFFLTRDYILGTQPTDQFNTPTLNQNSDNEINTADILFEINQTN